MLHETTATNTTQLLRHFPPDEVEEIRAAEWDKKTQSIITPSERNTNGEESVIANIPWLVDMSTIGDDESDTEVSFKSGVHFNFDEEISINTTRLGTAGIKSHLSKEGNDPKSLPSILKTTSDCMTVSSEIITDQT